MRWALLLGLLASSSGCSLLVDHFNECGKSSDCAPGHLCVQSYCVSTYCPNTYGSDAGDTIHWALLPLTDSTGKADPAEQARLQAALLALNQLASFPVGGHSFTVYVCDTGSDPGVLANELDYLIKKKGIVAGIHSGSAQVLAAAPVAVAPGVLVMSPSATSPAIASLNADAALPAGLRCGWCAAHRPLGRAPGAADGHPHHPAHQVRHPGIEHLFERGEQGGDPLGPG